MKRIPAALLALVALAGVRVAPAAGQSRSSSVAITATVDVALTGIAVQNLVFATATPGGSMTVTPGTTAGCTGCQAGKWQVQRLSKSPAAGRRFVQLTFTALPTTLARNGGGPPLAISWTNAANTCLATTGGGAEYYCFGAWTPSQGVMHSVRINPDPSGQTAQRDLNIYLGGTIAPPATQQAGYYSGVVTLQMAYGSF